MYYNNAYYARVGGISNVEVNSLEMEMLRMISFSLFVQPDQYERSACLTLPICLTRSRPPFSSPLAAPHGRVAAVSDCG